MPIEMLNCGLKNNVEDGGGTRAHTCMNHNYHEIKLKNLNRLK